MRLTEIQNLLGKSRSNGIYFHDKGWDRDLGSVGKLAYLSKDGHLFMTYLHPFENKRLVRPFTPDMENMLRPSDNLVIWEGSV